MERAKRIVGRSCALLSAALIAALLLFLLSPPESPPRYPLNNFLARIGEENRLSEERPIRIAFYGQSVILQDWWLYLADHIKRQYAGKRFEIRNFSVGGHTSDRLVKLVDSDILPFQPDIVFFHVYGPPASYEKIIRRIRQGTVADIVIANDHVTTAAELDEETDARKLFESDGLRSLLQLLGIVGAGATWKAWRNHVFLPEISSRYGSALIDVRSAWKAALRANRLPPSHYLRDDIHLNDNGNRLMYDIYRAYVDRAFVPTVGLRPKVAETEHRVRPDGGRAACFPIDLGDGYRIAIKADNPVEFNVKVNGMNPWNDPGLYWVTRTTNLPGTEWPGLLKIELSSRGRISDNGWAELVSRDEAGVYRFRVFSRTYGFQGEGRTDRDFHDPLGMLIIKRDDWNLSYAESTYKVASFVGTRIEWKVRPGAIQVRSIRPEDGWVDVYRATTNRALDLCVLADRPAKLRIQKYRAPLHCTFLGLYCRLDEG